MKPIGFQCILHRINLLTMKQVLTVAALVATLFFFGTSTASAQNGNGQGGNNGQAIAAFNQNCTYNGAVTTSAPQVISSCFAGGFLTRVYILPKVNCNQVDCTLIRIAAVGYVDFGCDGQVVATVCL